MCRPHVRGRESEFQTFVRPIRHAELTEFCTELTGITQDKVASAPPFCEVPEAMKEWRPIR